MRKKQKATTNRDLAASEVSENGELVSESGTTTDYEREDEVGAGGNGGGSRSVTSATT